MKGGITMVVNLIEKPKVDRIPKVRPNEAGLAGPVVLHGILSPDYSYRSVAQLSKRGQEKTWPAIAQ
jgi:hypothetical protein